MEITVSSYSQGGNRIPTQKTKKVYCKTLDPETSYLRKIYSSQRCDANPNHRNIPFELTFEEWRSLVTQNCYFCGAPPVLREGKIHMYQGNRVPINGIDRNIGELGYILNNSRPCCSRCNYMKHRLDDKTFINHVEKIMTHQRIK